MIKTVNGELVPAKMPMHPYKMLAYILEVNNIKESDFIEKACISQSVFDDFKGGGIGITDELVEKFANVFHTGIDYWIKMQKGYELECREFEAFKEILERYGATITEVPGVYIFEGEKKTFGELLALLPELSPVLVMRL